MNMRLNESETKVLWCLSAEYKCWSIAKTKVFFKKGIAVFVFLSALHTHTHTFFFLQNQQKKQ